MSTAVALAGVERRSGRTGVALARLVRSRTAVMGLAILVGVTLMAFFAPWIAPHDPRTVDVLHNFGPPAWARGGDPSHLLGTDSLGRDILSRIIYGARVSLIVGTSAVLIAGVAGSLLGLISGYYGGAVGDVIMRIAEIQMAFPFILLALLIMAVLGQGLVNIILVLGISGWVPYGRVVRGQVLQLREKEFVEAARAIGGGHWRIVFRHLLPNTMAPIIVIATFMVASTIVSEAALTFLGLGVEASTPTWGSMLAEGRDYLQVAWWLATFPGLAIMLTILGVNAVGDWLRDYLDPRLRL
ncbi:MAG: ABC transporter permease [Armatimonadota bacterium]